MIKHILFDCDGVLVDTEIIAAHRFVEKMAPLGIEVTVDHYLTVHTGSTFTAVLEHYLGATHSTEDRIKLMRELEKEVADTLVGIENVEAMLIPLDVDKSIVSNSHIAAVQDAVNKVGITKYFTGHIFSSESVEKPKPAPDVYHLALQTLGLKRNELVVVEDSLTGATAAKTAGLEVIGFTGASHILPGHHDKLLAMGIDSIANSMDELSIVLQKRLSPAK